ncbi:unnamed protein product, partial [Vitis vinifera]|uniref:Uncharacterized protein n=1 Tax=Vitis vinifera TaxID=29760 RepID=D7T098_VITVI
MLSFLVILLYFRWVFLVYSVVCITSLIYPHISSFQPQPPQHHVSGGFPSEISRQQAGGGLQERMLCLQLLPTCTHTTHGIIVSFFVIL